MCLVPVPVLQIVLTSPNNPSGVMWTAADFAMLVSVCNEACDGADSAPPRLPWIVVDQAYYEFVHHGPAHVFPNLAELGYPNQLIHLCSFSKAFSLAGWRLGYMA